MEYIVSRPYELPTTAAALAETFFFNLWGRRYWPYQALEVADILFWYFSPAKTIVWKSRTVQVDRFHYSDKQSLRSKLEMRFGTFDHEQPYFTEGTNSGYCLAYKVEALEALQQAKPDALRFPQLGWLRLESRQVVEWVGQSPDRNLATPPNNSLEPTRTAAENGH